MSNVLTQILPITPFASNSSVPSDSACRFISVLGVLFAGALMLSATVESGAKPLRAERWPQNVPVPEFKSAGDNFEVVGGAPNHDRRIVGITFKQDGDLHICSGLYISAKYILTAAHCACDDSTDYHVSNADSLAPDWRPARKIARYGNYNCQEGPRGGNDLALLQIDVPLKTGSGTSTCDAYSLLNNIKFQGDYLANPPKRVVVAGYGYEGDRLNSWGTRRAAVVKTNSFTCASYVPQAFGCSPMNELLLGVGRSDGFVRDTCAGDSGGPAYLSDGGKFIPIGIVSRGISVPQPYGRLGQCGAGGIYTHIGRRSVLSWLKANGVPSGSETCGAFQ